MASLLIRPTVRTAITVGVGVATTYAGYRHYTATQMAHAESPPSDTQAAVKKVTFGSFTALKLESAEMVNHNVKRLRFALPEGSESDVKTITSLLSQQYIDGSFIPTIRPYTPISFGSVEDPRHVTFLIKKYPGGKGSGGMHALQPGESVKFKSLHEYDYKPSSPSSSLSKPNEEGATILAIAGGSGITPIYQLTKTILSNPQDRTKIALIYANNTEADILLRDEFDELEAQYPDRFRKLFTVSKAADAAAAAAASSPSSTSSTTIETGYVTKEMITKFRSGTGTGQKEKVLVSGPPAMVEAVAGPKGLRGWTQGSVGGILKELGYESTDVHKF